MHMRMRLVVVSDDEDRLPASAPSARMDSSAARSISARTDPLPGFLGVPGDRIGIDGSSPICGPSPSRRPAL
jgi:hypothetical protein